MFIAFQLQINRYTKSTNFVLKQYLKTYVNYKQDNQVDFLFIAEFEANSNQNNLSNIAQSFVSKRYYPQSGLESPNLIEKYLLTLVKKDLKTTDSFVQKID